MTLQNVDITQWATKLKRLIFCRAGLIKHNLD